MVPGWADKVTLNNSVKKEADRIMRWKLAAKTHRDRWDVL